MATADGETCSTGFCPRAPGAWEAGRGFHGDRSDHQPATVSLAVRPGRPLVEAILEEAVGSSRDGVPADFPHDLPGGLPRAFENGGPLRGELGRDLGQDLLQPGPDGSRCLSTLQESVAQRG